MFGRKRNVKNIVVFGGSFNPPTVAHIQMVEEVASLKNVDEVWVCPSFSHRDKGDQSQSFSDRLIMCELAMARIPKVKVSSADRIACEKYEKGVGSAYNLFLTVRRMSWVGAVPANIYPLIGADCLKDLPNWYDYSTYMSYVAGFVVYERKNVNLCGLEEAFINSDKILHRGKLTDTEQEYTTCSSTKVRDLFSHIAEMDRVNARVGEIPLHAQTERHDTLAVVSTYVHSSTRQYIADKGLYRGEEDAS